MTAWPEARGTGAFLAAVATRAERWLLEPATPRPRATEPEPDTRPVVAVVGLGRKCGTTTIARALAIELASRDRSGTALVTAESRGPTAALATASARRLARSHSDGSAAAAAGRLCLLDPDTPSLRDLAAARPAPVVLDVGHGRHPEGPVALADVTVLVAAPFVEPALADVVAASLTRTAGPPPVLLNRAVDIEGWTSRDVLAIGESRLGARLALAGRDPTPALARPLAGLADALVGEEEST